MLEEVDVPLIDALVLANIELLLMLLRPFIVLPLLVLVLLVLFISDCLDKKDEFSK